MRIKKLEKAKKIISFPDVNNRKKDDLEKALDVVKNFPINTQLSLHISRKWQLAK